MVDPISHGLAGFFIAYYLINKLKLNTVKLPVLLGVISGMIPDIDVVLTFFSVNSYLTYHRIVTHCLLAVLILSLVLTASFNRHHHEFKHYFLISSVAILSHLLLDSVTGRGIMLFYPFSHTMLNFNILPPFSIWLLLIFAAGIVTMEIVPLKKFKIVRNVLIMSSIFLLVMAGFYSFTVHKINTDIVSGKNYVVPTIFDPLKWRIVNVNQNIYTVFNYGPLHGLENLVEFKMENNNIIKASMKSELVKTIITISKVPVAKNNNNEVKWFDLRLSNDGSRGYTAVVFLDNNLNIKKELLRV